MIKKKCVKNFIKKKYAPFSQELYKLMSQKFWVVTNKFQLEQVM